MNPGSLKIVPSGDREIVITRAFDAPRHLVFDAMTKTDLLKRWLFGPDGWSMVVCDNDLKVGGSFRHVWRSADGQEMALHGTYREIVPPERIVRTEKFEFGCDSQAGEQIGTLVLTEQHGKTNLRLTVQYPSKEARDGTLASGMEKGLAPGYERVDALLAAQLATADKHD